MAADRLAVTRKKCATFFDAGGMRERDVPRAHRLFLAASTGSGDSSNSHAQCAANLAANAIGQRDGHFTAYGSFGLDQFWRNIRPRRFQLIAIADDAAQEIRGTARDARQPLR